jgi:cytoskeleton protein RodZ
MERQQGMEQALGATKSGVGATLREARENMGMSVEEVAIRLKFAPRQITALEEENFERLPELTFVRGFVRSYARLLQIAEAPLLEALPGAPVQEAVPVKRAREDVLPGDSGTRKQNLIWLAGALAVAVVIVFLAWKYDAGEAMPKPATGAKTGAEVKPATETQIGTATQPGGEHKVGPEAQTGTETQTGSETKAGPVMQPAKESVATAPALPGTSVIAAAKPAARKASPASAVSANNEAVPRKQRPARPVRLEFDEDSWVEIKDGNGKILLSMLGKQGTSQSVSGSPPFSVTIGNAKGVRVYYKDEALDLGTHADQDVARLRLE